MIQVTAFKWVPDFAQGSVRDIRVRWALEEAGLGYDDRLIGFESVNARIPVPAAFRSGPRLQRRQGADV